jgi:hypothetical protein
MIIHSETCGTMRIDLWERNNKGAKTYDVTVQDLKEYGNGKSCMVFECNDIRAAWDLLAAMVGKTCRIFTTGLGCNKP